MENLSFVLLNFSLLKRKIHGLISLGGYIRLNNSKLWVLLTFSGPYRTKAGDFGLSNPMRRRGHGSGFGKPYVKNGYVKRKCHCFQSLDRTVVSVIK